MPVRETLGSSPSRRAVTRRPEPAVERDSPLKKGEAPKAWGLSGEAFSTLSRQPPEGCAFSPPLLRGNSSQFQSLEADVAPSSSGRGLYPFNSNTPP